MVTVATLQQLAAQEKNAQRQQQLLAQANSLALVAGRIEADLVGVNGLTRGLQTQRAGLAARRNQAQIKLLVARFSVRHGARVPVPSSVPAS